MKPIWIRKVYFSVEMFFVRYDLQSNVTVLSWFGFYRKYGEETEGFQNDWIRAYMSFKTLPIPIGCKLKF